ncbi:hypothetical protein AAHA92_11024 [Salvia divinorum]|uniref:Uncharacterized protein n=1 Tax=Salvia divinorum TaxID=28513 RepID=A0ABD1HWM2_SALDI
MLEGEIPISLSKLSHLRVLILYGNDLRGNLDELFGNKSGKGILESLQILDLAHNQFNGSLPDLTALSALTEVYLGVNNFSGSIPLSIGQLSELQALDLSNNLLNGVVSESHFIKLHKLKELDLSFNSLIVFDFVDDWSPTFQLDIMELAGCSVGPSFPKWIKTQTNFSFLDISRANIADEVPTWLWSVSHSLYDLYLFDNQITGMIPNLSSTSILRIDLSNNSITGPIPLFNDNAQSIHLSQNMFSGLISSICNVRRDKLWSLDLSNNQLGVEIPNCWEKMSNLFSLNFANNRFCGEIPRSLGFLRSLNVLQLRGNSLSGEFPSTLRRCQSLNLLDVAGNELTGDIPSWLGEMYNIRILNLAKNKLHGSIPVEICNLTRIRILNLSKNNLSGKIPDCFNKFTSMAQKNSPFRNLGYAFSFQYNADLPNEILNLAVLDLSNNNLSGKIPTSTQLQSFNASAYAKNKGLCGPPLALCPEDSFKPSTTSPGGNMNERDGNDLSFMQEVGISMAFGFIFGFWGVVGTFILKKSWRIAFFNWFDDVGDWFYVRIAIFVSKLGRRS